MAQELKAEVRKEKGTRQMVRLRSGGRIPAVVYGGDRKESTALSIDGREFTRALEKGERVLNLKIGDQDSQVQVKDVQYDALGEIILHVDFNELRAGEKIELAVAVVLRGVPKGAADGGVLNQMLHELNIECAPTAIPDRITVDVEGLGLSEAVHISEIELPEGVKVLARGTAVVANCTEPRKEEEPEPVEVAEGAVEPEVLSEKKEEGEGEAAGAGAESKAGEAKKAAEPKDKEGK